MSQDVSSLCVSGCAICIILRGVAKKKREGFKKSSIILENMSMPKLNDGVFLMGHESVFLSLWVALLMCVNAFSVWGNMWVEDNECFFDKFKFISAKNLKW